MRVFAAIVFVYVIQACAAAQIRDQEAERFAAKISSLVDRLAQRQSFLKQLEDILGGEIFEQQQGRYAIIKSPQHNTLAAIEEQGGDSVVTELVIYPKSDLKLTFQDLQVTMGKWQIDQEYQASSPVFECVSADRKIVVSVYVTLLFPPTDPISRIVSIRIQVASTETEKG